MTQPVPDVTLQINLCAGDLAYCEQTVPALIDTHRSDVREVLAVVDCCTPQSTPVLCSPSQFPPREFAARIERLRALCADWQAQGLFDRIEYLESDAERLRRVNKKYCGRATGWSHDHRGHAFSAYFAAWEYTRTRYVLHFDADILLHQETGYSWVRAGVSALGRNSGMLAVSPRIAPPLSGSIINPMVSVSAPGSGWLPTWRLDASPLGWTSDWFSTRCHLLDRERLSRILPLTPRRGRAAHAFDHFLNVALSPLYDAAIWTRSVPERGGRRWVIRLARKLAYAIIPPFPLPPEVLLYERAARYDLNCLYLRDERAWFIHPDTKPASFISLLPHILDATRRGQSPEAQRGVSGVQLGAWTTA
jgi:hypothetical protein